MSYRVFLAVWNGEPVRLQFGCDLAAEVRDNLIAKNIAVSSVVETDVQIQRSDYENAQAHRLIVYALAK